MKLTSELVTEKVKQMMDYSKDNFGLPNGDDFPEIAKILADTTDFNHMAFLHFVMVCLSNPEFTQKHLVEIKDSKEALSTAIPKHGGFKSYLDAVYLGYLLGKSVTETELLENMHGGNELTQ